MTTDDDALALALLDFHPDCQDPLHVGAPVVSEFGHTYRCPRCASGAVFMICEPCAERVLAMRLGRGAFMVCPDCRRWGRFKTFSLALVVLPRAGLASPGH